MKTTIEFAGYIPENEAKEWSLKLRATVRRLGYTAALVYRPSVEGFLITIQEQPGDRIIGRLTGTKGIYV